MEDGTSKSPTHCRGTDYDNDPFQWDAREDCEVRQILDRIADKWSLLAIALLEVRTLRFTELQRRIDGISQRMLTVRCITSSATASSVAPCTPSSPRESTTSSRRSAPPCTTPSKPL